MYSVAVWHKTPASFTASWKRCGHQTKEGLLDVSDRLDWKDNMVRLQHGHDRHSDVSQEQMRDCVPLDPPDIASCASARLHQPWWNMARRLLEIVRGAPHILDLLFVE